MGHVLCLVPESEHNGSGWLCDHGPAFGTSIVSRWSYLGGPASLLYVTGETRRSATLLIGAQPEGNSAVLSNPLTLTATFILGSASGTLLTYLRQKHVLPGLLRVVKTAILARGQSPDSPANFAMKALIIARDPEVISIFAQVFREKRISTEGCDPDAAVARLSSAKFAAIVLDFDHLPECVDVLRNVPAANKAVVVLGVASDSLSKAIASRVGTNLVVERPLDRERLRHSVTSAYGRMLRDSQVYFRLAIELRVAIRRANGEVLECTTLNISQTGMAVNTPAVFSVGEAIHLAFAIPNTDIFVSAEGKVIWDDKHGKAGISFECSSSSISAPFREWLHDHFHMKLESTSPSESAQQAAYVH